MRKKKYNQGGTPLTLAVQEWPTPTVDGNYNRKGASKKSGDGLATAVKRKWPTPAARDYRSHGSVEGYKRRRKKGHQQQLPEEVYFQACGGKTIPLKGQLNPEWVEWLMGWPIGWTALKPLEMDRFLTWLQSRGIC